MRTTLNIDDDLMREAVRQTGVKSKTDVVELALRALLEREARRKLKALYGKVPEPHLVRRRRQ
ncbi:MAG: type II toxin-antitoxin system VapB family antitoxin [Myxococcaceae bacterium]